MAVKVAINGFGRIGRNVLRAIVEFGRDDIEVVAINDLGPVETNAHLMRYDSVHGRFPGTVTVEGDTIDVGRGPIRVTAERDPKALPWGDVDVALECTGIFTDKAKAALHLENGSKRVLVSAPGGGADKTIVFGVNDKALTRDDLVVSNASCTTNCLAPVAYVLHKAIGIEKGFMTTIHSYTGDQPTLDTLHKDLYRGRAAALSMIPTSTGAAKAVGLVLPELNGKLDGVAIRVPTPNVSVVDFKFLASAPTRSTRSTPRSRPRPTASSRASSATPPRSSSPPTSTTTALLGLPHGPDQGDGRHFLPRHVLVRQRVGLLEPHGRHRRRHGQADLTSARRRWSASTPPLRPASEADAPVLAVLMNEASHGLSLHGWTADGRSPAPTPGRSGPRCRRRGPARGSGP